MSLVGGVLPILGDRSQRLLGQRMRIGMVGSTLAWSGDRAGIVILSHAQSRGAGPPPTPSGTEMGPTGWQAPGLGMSVLEGARLMPPSPAATTCH